MRKSAGLQWDWLSFSGYCRLCHVTQHLPPLPGNRDYRRALNNGIGSSIQNLAVAESAIAAPVLRVSLVRQLCCIQPHFAIEESSPS